MLYRPLANTGLMISEVALGCWPIAGMTSPGTNDDDSLATIRACFDLGINHLDTAYCYGREGQSERLIARALGSRRKEMVIATKAGLHWDAAGRQTHDASPATLRRECEESLRRLATDHVELLYLHAPDHNVPMAESAGALRRTDGRGEDPGRRGLEPGPGPVAGVRPRLPLGRLPAAVQHAHARRSKPTSSVVSPAGRGGDGLLAADERPLGRQDSRDMVFGPNDSRHKYAAFQGVKRKRNHDLVERLQEIAAEAGHTVAELVIHWTIQQPGITAAVCGAKRAEQIRETAGGSGWQLSDELLARIQRLLP